jgi:hypothetical protein
MSEEKEYIMIKKFFLAAAVLVLAACQAAPQAKEVTPTPDHGPITVIDSPTEGALLMLDNIIIQAHADDAQGVARGEVSVGGEVIALIESAHPGQPAAVFTLPWRPTGPGDVRIEIRAQNMAGTWGALATRRVTITAPTATHEVATPTITGTPVLSTSAPTVTSTPVIPTPTPGPVTTEAPVTPMPELNSSIFSFSFSALHFYPRNAKCLPNDSGLTVNITNMTNVANVFAFFAMTDTGVYHFPAHRWTTGLLLWQSAPGSSYFWHKITSETIIDEVTYYPNYVLYQFVATDFNGTIIARSPIYRDMSIVECKQK